jgi:hypothetical protein
MEQSPIFASRLKRKLLSGLILKGAYIGAKENVLQLRGVTGGVAALLILLKRWLGFSFFVSVVECLHSRS